MMSSVVAVGTNELKQVPIAISVEKSLTRAFPGRAVIVRYIQRGSAELDPLQY